MLQEYEEITDKDRKEQEIKIVVESTETVPRIDRNVLLNDLQSDEDSWKEGRDALSGKWCESVVACIVCIKVSLVEMRLRKSIIRENQGG